MRANLTVKQLREALKTFEDTDEVIIWFKWNGDFVCDEAVELGRNGNALQITGWSVFEVE
jgi:hypothetical protein